MIICSWFSEFFGVVLRILPLHVYKETDEWYIEWQRVVQRVTMNDNEWRRVAQRVTTSDTTRDNDWQQMTTSDNKWQRMTTSDNEWQRRFG